MNSLRLPSLFAMLGVSAFAQSSPDATLQVLINEVRQLRLALERSAVVAPKIHMTLQRLQSQQELVARTSRELDMARSQMARSNEEEAGLVGEIQHVERLIAHEQDASRRKGVETKAIALKAMLERKTSATSELRGREVELSGRFRADQAKLDDLNERLNTLERLLDTPQPRQQ